ncbi:MAG: OmpH family outer membrane protein [Planctomycetes bacterium]|jgi:Skp family chaperone for outer membrane proteins|nr:OmpH family outer membrane protein [Planctomycetota bacterium]
MKRLSFVLLVALSLLAGIGGGFIGNKISTPEPVHAQAAAKRADRDVRIALVDLVKATRSAKMYTDRKLEFEKQVSARKERMRLAAAEYETLAAELEEMKRMSKDATEIQRKELRVKAKQEEAKVIREFVQQWLEELSNDFQKEVLAKVHDTIKDYAKRNGYDLVFQLYELEAGAGSKDDDAIAATRAWAETLKNMPVLYSQTTMPNGAPNEFVKDITDDIINLVKG